MATLTYDWDFRIDGYILGDEGETSGYLCTFHAREHAATLETQEEADVQLQPLYSWDPDETDTPQHCCHLGCDALIPTDLTPDGEEYVRDALEHQDIDSNEILQAWAREWPRLDPRRH